VVEGPIPSVSEAVKRAAAICDPADEDPIVAGLVERYEDDDRPATSVEELAAEVEAAAREGDPAGPGPAAEMTAMAATWIATNSREADDPERVLREAARAAYDGHPPEPIGDWLRERGVELG
jgi:hypothetical protein